MTMAISKAVEHGAKAVICASTGNTSASAAAYATHAGITAAVLVPEGQDRDGQAVPGDRPRRAAAAGAGQLRRLPRPRPRAREAVPGAPRQLGEQRPDRGAEDRRVRGRRRARRRPRLPLRAGRATPGTTRPTTAATARTSTRGATTRLPRMFGFQAAGSAPIVEGHVVQATRRRSPPRSASATRRPGSSRSPPATDSDGYFGAIDDAGILAAHRILSAEVGIFVEPASAISVAGLLERADAGAIPAGSTCVLTVTGPRPQGPAVGAEGPGRRGGEADHRAGRRRRRGETLGLT